MHKIMTLSPLCVAPGVVQLKLRRATTNGKVSGCARGERAPPPEISGWQWVAHPHKEIAKAYLFAMKCSYLTG